MLTTIILYGIYFQHLFLKGFIYLFVRESKRAQAGRGAGRWRSRLPAEQGAPCGTQSQDAGIMT